MGAGRNLPVGLAGWPTGVRLLVLALLLSPLSSLCTHAQEQEQEQERAGVFSDVIEVRVVNIEVVVTDRDGIRVTGLKPQDFRLRVDGEEVPIEYFSEIRGGAAVEAGAGVQEGVQGVPSVVPGTPVRTNYLVFVDDFFSIARDRNRVLDKLEEDLGNLGPDDRLALVAFDGKDLTMLTTWTQSQRDLRRAFQEARARDAFGLQRLAELRTNDSDRRSRRELDSTTADFIAQTGDAPEEPFLRTFLEGIELNYATRLADQVERSVLGAVATLRSFAAPPGRKVMLLLSGGWPYSPAEYTVNDFNASIEETLAGVFEQGIPGREELLRPLSDTANRLGYTLYPVDVPGLSRETGVDASRGVREDPVTRPAGSSVGTSVFPREDHHHSSLVFLADETGGRALLNAQRDVALEEVALDTRSYYWIGFSPQRREDDERHDIQVEVLGEGLRARFREGFVDLSRESEVTLMVESSLLFGNPPSTRPLDLRFGRPKRRARGRMDVPLEVGIPLDDVVLLPEANQYRGELEIRVTAMDAEGDRSETPMDKIVIAGPTAPRPGQRFWYETVLKLRRRQHRIVVAVYDPLSGSILSSTGEIEP